MAVQASELIAQISVIGAEEAFAQLTAVGESSDLAAASLARVEEAASAGSAVLAEVASEAAADSGGLDALDASASGTTDILRGLAAIIETLQTGFSDLDASISEVVANTADIAGSSSDAASSLAELAASASEAASATSEVGTASEEAGGGIAGFLGSIGDAAMSLGMFYFNAQATVSILEGLGGALFGADAQMEQTRVAFTTLTGSASAANEMIQQLVNFAATTPFHEQGIEDAAAKLLAFGFNAKEVIPDLTAIGDVLSGLGKASDASLRSIVDIFGKIEAQGKLTGGAMMQLTRWGIPAWQLLSKEMGVPIPVLQEMVKKGLVPAKTAIDDLRKGIESSPLFSGGMKKQAETFNGLMSTLQDNIKTAWRAFTGPLFEQAKGALIQIGNLVSSKGFQDWAKEMGKDVGIGITAVVGFVKDDLIPAFQAISTWIKDNKPLFTALGKDIQSIGPILQLIGEFLKEEFQPVWQQLVDTFNNQLKPAWDQFMQALQPAMPALQLIGEVIAGVVIVALILFVTMIAQTAKAVIFSIGLIIQGVGLVVDSFLNFLTNMTNIVKAIIAIWNGIPGFFSGLWKTVMNAFNIYVSAAEFWGQNLINNFLNGLKSSWTNVVNWINNALSYIAGLFPHSPVKHGPLQGIENWGGNITKALASGIRAGTSDVQSAFNSMLGPLGSSNFGVGSSFTPSLGGSGATIVLNQPPAQIYIDGHELVNHIGTPLVQQIYRGAGVRRAP